MRYVCLSDLNPGMTAALDGGLPDKVFELMDAAVTMDRAPSAEELVAGGLEEPFAALLSAHLNYVLTLRREGRQPYGGPCADFSGAINIYETATEAEAIALHDADPFCRAGFFRLARCIPWRQVVL